MYGHGRRYGAHIVVLLLLCATAGACTGGRDGAASGPPGSNRGAIVGRIDQVLNSVVSMNGRRVASGEDIPSGAQLVTDDSGTARFGLRALRVDCQLQPSSSIKMPSSPEGRIEAQRGKIDCGADTGSSETLHIGTPEGSIAGRGATLIVDVQPDAVTLAVARGFADVESETPPQGAATERPVARLVGPGQRYAIARAGAGPAVLDVFELDQAARADQQALESMPGTVEPANPPLAAAGTSPVLERVRKSNVLHVAVDDRATEPASRFVRAHFGSQAGGWKTTPDVRMLPRAQIETGLRAGTLDVAVTPERPGGARSVAFFADETARPWSMVVSSGDAPFEEVLRGGLLASLRVGQFGRQYLDAFGKTPDYELNRDLIFPDRPRPARPSPSPAPPPAVAPSPGTAAPPAAPRMPQPPRRLITPPPSPPVPLPPASPPAGPPAPAPSPSPSSPGSANLIECALQHLPLPLECLR